MNSYSKSVRIWESTWLVLQRVMQRTGRKTPAELDKAVRAWAKRVKAD